jgi:ribonuclease HII
MAKRQRSPRRTAPTYWEEEGLLAQGYALVGGLDEVGRGPLAGPVVAAVVVLPSRPRGRWARLIRDSKQTTPKQRERVLPHLQDHAVGLEVGISSSGEIDRIGIVAATRLAMRRAIDSLAIRPQFLLIDALTLPDVPIPQKAIIHGDALCLSIAAASIAAKVARDRIMVDEDVMNPGYGFAQHKGYGTAEHFRNLRRLGPCPIHRYSFAPVREMAGR